MKKPETVWSSKVIKLKTDEYFDTKRDMQRDTKIGLHRHGTQRGIDGVRLKIARHRYTKKDKQNGTTTHRQKCKCRYREAQRGIDVYKYKNRRKDKYKNRQSGTKRYRQRGRKRDRQGGTKRDRRRDTTKDRQRGRKRDGQCGVHEGIDREENQMSRQETYFHHLTTTIPRWRF